MSNADAAARERPSDAPADADVDAAVLADVERVMADLAGLTVSLDDPADLERLRQQLPTEPRRARLLHAMLPPALADAIEYVGPSARQAGYWRRSRERSDPMDLSPAELRQRIAFVETQQDLADLEGTVALADGRRVSRTAVETARRLGGESFDAPDDPPGARERARGAKLLGRLKQTLGV